MLRAAAPHIDWDGEALRESCEKVAAIGAREAARDALGMNEPDGFHFWTIPSQAATECRATESGSVDIWQEGRDDAVISVAAGNAVMLARHILYAAGFRSVGIYTHTPKGNVDIEDGDLAGTFYDVGAPAGSE